MFWRFRNHDFFIYKETKNHAILEYKLPFPLTKYRKFILTILTHLSFYFSCRLSNYSDHHFTNVSRWYRLEMKPFIIRLKNHFSFPRVTYLGVTSESPIRLQKASDCHSITSVHVSIPWSFTTAWYNKVLKRSQPSPLSKIWPNFKRIFF